MDDKVSPQTGEELAVAIRPTLDAFVEGCGPYLKKVTDEIYEQLLNSAQDYIRENGEWNLGAEIDRCRKIEADNRWLRVRHNEMILAVEDARAALHNHYVDWDGEPEDAVPLQLARSRCDAVLALARGEPKQ